MTTFSMTTFSILKLNIVALSNQHNYSQYEDFSIDNVQHHVISKNDIRLPIWHDNTTHNATLLMTFGITTVHNELSIIISAK